MHVLVDRKRLQMSLFINVLKYIGIEPGTVVLQVTANDPDLNPVLQYNFAPGGNPNSTFSIDAYSGKIAIAKELDYEIKSSYVLKVQASDKNHTVDTEVTVNLIDENDNAPAFTQQSYQVNNIHHIHTTVIIFCNFC